MATAEISPSLSGAGAAPQGLPRRQIFAVASGNAIEIYDFVSYAYFAVQIGRTFFPSDSPGISLLASLATFGVGFLARPLGALVLGRLGDRIGRKPAMLTSFGLMGLGSIGLPLIPSYASIGIAAPILAVMFRLIQGFAVGGEIGASTTFLMEAAPPHRRGLYVSLQAMSADAAALTAGLVGLFLAFILEPAQLDAWGWRLALLLGAIIIPFAIMLRRTLEETLPEAQQHLAPPPVRSYRRVAIAGIGLVAAATTTNYLLKYMTTYAQSTLGMSAQVAFGASAMVGLAGVICDPIGGWLSDRYGRKRVMLIPWLVLALLVFPCFFLIEAQRTPLALYLGCGILAAVSCLSTSVSLVSITEALPQRVRSAAFGLIYAFAVSIFGGSAQFLVAWITRMTENPLTPAWYMICGVVVGLLAIRAMPETAPIRIEGER